MDEKAPLAEHTRLAEDARREKNWKRWGPYLALSGRHSPYPDAG